jgi:hypothetical protein
MSKPFFVEPKIAQNTSSTLSFIFVARQELISLW